MSDSCVFCGARARRPPRRRKAAANWGRRREAAASAEVLPDEDDGQRALLVQLARAQTAAVDAGIELTAAEIAALPILACDGEALPWLDDPPDGFSDDAEYATWTSSLPAEIRAIWEAPSYDGEGEAQGTGFTHHDRAGGPRGEGFAAGGAHDVMPPGPELAAAVHAAAGGPAGTTLAGLNESALIGVLCAYQRLASWAQAGTAATLSTLVTRRKAQAIERETPALAAHLDQEAAAALALTGHAATRLLQASAMLARLPGVHAALAAGRIDWPKACLFADLLAGLPSDDASEIADSVLEDCDRRTTGQLRAALTRAILAYDPDAARQRRKRARRETAVQLWHEPSGNAAVAGRELDPADVITVDARLSAATRWLKANGAAGTTDQLRAALFITWLAGRPITTLLPGTAGDGQHGAAPTGSAQPGSAQPGSGPSHDDPSPSGARADGPHRGGAHDSGPRGSNPGRHQPHDASSGPSHDDPGQDDPSPSGARADVPHHSDPGHGDPSQESPSDGAVLSGPGGWPPLTGTINLTRPLTAWLGLTSRPGELAGYGALDADACRQLAAAADTATRWCLTLTTPEGQAVAHACAPCAPDPTASGIAWAASLRDRLEYLETGTCSHARRSPRYKPPPRLRHLIQVRHRTCGAPGCRRSAWHCDLDHTLAWHKGGVTCECGLAPMCRHHHRVKQSPGWHVSHRQPGILTWTTPSGRTYVTRPDQYPV